jgi:hypothetical protein
VGSEVDPDLDEDILVASDHRRSSRRVDLAPDFQRASVWKPRTKSRLIESVLLGIPLPMFYFNAEPDRRLQVVDGVQRLTAVREFVDGTLSLEGLEYLTTLNGKRWVDLDPASRRGFHQTQIVVHVIDATTPSEVKADIFKRINTGGEPLSAQEIRHAMSHKRSRDLLARMTRTDAFDRATRGMSKSGTRMIEREFALRFLAFKLDPDLTEYGQASTLDDFLLRITKRLDNPHDLTNEVLRSFEMTFERAMLAAWEIFGEHAFSLWPLGDVRKSRISRALFDSWSVALSETEFDELRPRKDAIVHATRTAFATDAVYIASVTQGTNVKERIQKRFQVARSILRKA